MYNKHLFGLLIVSVISCSSWLVVVNKLSPNNHTELALLFFFLSAFIAIASGLSLVLFFLRLKFLKSQYSSRMFNISIRQGLLLSFLAIFALMFQLMKVLNWWTGLLVVVVVAILEYYFSYNESRLV